MSKRSIPFAVSHGPNPWIAEHTGVGFMFTLPSDPRLRASCSVQVLRGDLIAPAECLARQKFGDS